MDKTGWGNTRKGREGKKEKSEEKNRD